MVKISQEMATKSAMMDSISCALRQAEHDAGFGGVALLFGDL